MVSRLSSREKGLHRLVICIYCNLMLHSAIFFRKEISNVNCYSLLFILIYQTLQDNVVYIETWINKKLSGKVLFFFPSNVAAKLKITLFSTASSFESHLIYIKIKFELGIY